MSAPDYLALLREKNLAERQSRTAKTEKTPLCSSCSSSTEPTTSISTAVRHDPAHDEFLAKHAAVVEIDGDTTCAEAECIACPAQIEVCTTSIWWRIHHADSAPRLVSTTPTADADEMQCAYPAAASVEPYSPPAATPDRAMTASDEAAIRAWLARIDETNPAIIADVMAQCQRDADARAYFVGRARVTQ